MDLYKRRKNVENYVIKIVLKNNFSYIKIKIRQIFDEFPKPVCRTNFLPFFQSRKGKKFVDNKDKIETQSAVNTNTSDLNS